LSSQLVGIAERYDRELAGVTDEALKRVFAAYDASYRNLVKSLRDAFPRLEQAGSISTLVRQGAIAAELGEALKFIDPAAAKELEALGRDTIRQAGELGQQLAGDTLNYVGVQSTFTTVPVGAVRNQAERFRERLVNYSDQQASAISAVVEQGLIQGWGTRKVEGQLRGLGVSFKSNAETVARTEVMSAYNGAARSRYEQAGVAYIQWIATPAEGTCSLCYARNTKVWKITEAPSVPAHPRCRCTTLPVSSLDQIDTAFYEAYSQDGLDDLARQKLAPDNGLTYWEKKAGATLAKPVWVPGQVIPKPEPVKAKPKPATKEQVAPPKENRPYFDRWSDSYKDAPELFKRVIEQLDYPGEIPSDGTEGAYQRGAKIHMGSFEPGIGRADSVWRHEYGHYVDYLIGRSQGGARSPIRYFSSSPEGIKAMSSDRQSLNKAKDMYEDMRSLYYDKWVKLIQKARVTASVSSDYKSLLESAPSVFKEIDRALNAKDSDFARETIAAAILTKDPERFIDLAEEALKTRYQGKSPVVAADLAGAITRNNIGYGHEDDYYNDPGLQETEAFANVFSMISSGNKLESEIAKYIAPTFSKFVEDTLSQFLNDTLQS